MKILIVASNMVHINNFHLPYIEKFKQLGHSVYVMANGEGADFNIKFKKRAFSPKNFALSFKIRKILKKEKFDIVYLHTTLAAFWVRFAMKGMKNRPYVVNTVHGFLFSENTSFLSRFLYLKCEKFLKKVTDDLIVMNSEDCAVAIHNKLCMGKVYEINGMGVDFDKFKIEHQPKINERINLTFVGELSKRKNQMFLVKAMKKLPNYHLTLVGDGDERKKIEKYISKNNLTDSVEITGYTKDVKKYLERTDIYVCASKIEGLPFNIMEAMGAKLPIVSSDIKGVRDLLANSNGKLYPYGDEEEYIKIVKTINIGEIEYDIDKYSLDGVLKDNMEIYTSSFDTKESEKVEISV